MELEAWLTKQLKDQRLSMSELGRRSGISHSTISRVLSGKQPPTSDFCKAISGALKVPQVEVEILAGILPKPPGWTAEREEWNALFNDLSEEERADFLVMGRARNGRRGKQKKG